MNESNTPRTDAECATDYFVVAASSPHTIYIRADFARTLERENQELRERLEKEQCTTKFICGKHLGTLEKCPQCELIRWMVQSSEWCENHNKERDQLQQQLAAQALVIEQMREALEEISTHLIPINTALNENCDRAPVGSDDYTYWQHEIKAHQRNSTLINNALLPNNPTNEERK